MKYHALFVIFEKSGRICNCRLLQIIGGALRVNSTMGDELVQEKKAGQLIFMWIRHMKFLVHSMLRSKMLEIKECVMEGRMDKPKPICLLIFSNLRAIINQNSSMSRKFLNHTLQTNPWYREE